MSRFRFALSSLAAFALAGIVQASPLADVSRLQGKAVRSNAEADGGTGSLARGAALEAGDDVHVTEGHVELTLADHSVLAFAEGTDVMVAAARITGDQRESVVLRMKTGAAWLRVEPTPASTTSFEISTERARIRTGGARFHVSVDPASGDTDIVVEEGSVGVTRRPSSMAQAGTMAARIEQVEANQAVRVHRDTIERVQPAPLKSRSFRRFLRGVPPSPAKK